MTPQPENGRRWLAVVAAPLAFLLLYQTVGVWPAMGIVLGAVAVAFRLLTHHTSTPQNPRLYCLDCGAALPPGTRQCAECDSTAVSYRN